MNFLVLFVLFPLVLTSQEEQKDSVTFNIKIAYEINENNRPEAAMFIADSIEYVYEFLIAKWGKTIPDYFGVRRWNNVTIEGIEKQFNAELMTGKISKNGDFVNLKIKDEPPNFKRVTALKIKLYDGKYNALNNQDISNTLMRYFYNLLLETIPAKDETEDE